MYLKVSSLFKKSLGLAGVQVILLNAILKIYYPEV